MPLLVIRILGGLLLVMSVTCIISSVLGTIRAIATACAERRIVSAEIINAVYQAVTQFILFIIFLLAGGIMVIEPGAFSIVIETVTITW